MITIRIADFVIGIENQYSYIEELCKDYLTNEPPQRVVSCTEQEIEAEAKQSEEPFENGYLEAICAYRKICLELPKYDAFILHSAVIAVDGKAYAFTAKSGTGKSTHIRLWGKYLGYDRVFVVNGDKPIIRKIGDTFYAYGTPWCGKEGWQTNTKAPLCGLCFVERGLQNEIAPYDKQDSASRIMSQILMPSDPENAMKTLELMDSFITNTNTWLLKCNMDVQAAQVAYEAMAKENK